MIAKRKSKRNQEKCAPQVEGQYSECGTKVVVQCTYYFASSCYFESGSRSFTLNSGPYSDLRELRDHLEGAIRQRLFLVIAEEIRAVFLEYIEDRGGELPNLRFGKR